MSEKRYVRVSKGWTDSSLIPSDSNVYEIISNPNKDYYRSLYYYNEDHYKTFQETKSVKGITGVTTNRIIFDLDSKTNLEQTKLDTIELCSRLTSAGLTESDFIVYFSGNKGFHVELETNEFLNRNEYENTIFNFAGDLQTLDKKVTDDQRLFRLPYTRHQETGLYKIPITFDTLTKSSVEEIKKVAKRKPFTKVSTKIITLPDSIKNLKTRQYKPVEVSTVGSLEFTDKLDVTKCPKWLTPARYALQEGFFKHGDRNDAFMILASTYKNQGFTDNQAYAMLQTVADIQAQRNNENRKEDDYLWGNVVKSVYSPTHRGGKYKETHDLLVRTRVALGLDVVIDEEPKVIHTSKVSTMIERFIARSKNLEERQIKTGIEELDDKLFLQPGMMVSLLGHNGGGKTQAITNIIQYNSTLGQNVLFFSLDMYEDAIVSRLLSKFTGLSYKEIIMKISKDDIDDNMKQGFEQIQKHFNNVNFDFRSGLTIEEIEETIIRTEESTGKIKMIVIDYLEKVRGPFAEATANGSFIASRLSDMAKKHDLVIFLLVQPNKAAGTINDPLLSYSAIKGSSVISQDSRVVLTLWRPGYNPQDSSMDKYVSLCVVKNTMGSVGTINLGWNPIKGDLKKLTRSEKIELQEFLNNKEQEKEAKVFRPWNKDT